MVSQRGSTLAVTLMVGAFALLLAFTLAAIGFFHLNVSTRAASSDTARNLAECTIALATDRFMEAFKNGHLDYGLHHETVSFSYPGAPPGESGQLSFNPNQSQIPCSLNNVASLGPVDGSLHRVPGACVYLVAVGHSGSEVRTLQVLFHVPQYGAELTTGGTVSSTGGLMVGTVPPGTGLLDTFNVNALQPGNIYANSSDATAAISLGPNSTVAGSVQAVGNIQLNGAVVEGQVSPFHGAVAVPSIDITSFDTSGRPNLQIITPGVFGTLSVTSPPVVPPPVVPLQLAGFARCNGNLEVAGDATFSSGVLYVNGNLWVHGTLSGVGAIITTGTLRVDGFSQLSSNNQVALLAGGDVTLTGSGGTTGSALQGLVYTRGTLTAHDMSLVGIFVADGPTASVQLNNVDVALNPSLAHMGLITSNPMATQPQGLIPSPGVTLSQIYSLTPQDIAAGRALPANASVDDYINAMHLTFRIGGGPTNPNPPNVPNGTIDGLGLHTWISQNNYQSQNLLDPNGLWGFAIIGYARALLGAIGPVDPGQAFSVDITQFVSPDDSLHLLYWHLQ